MGTKVPVAVAHMTEQPGVGGRIPGLYTLASPDPTVRAIVPNPSSLAGRNSLERRVKPKARRLRASPKGRPSFVSFSSQNRTGNLRATDSFVSMVGGNWDATDLVMEALMKLAWRVHPSYQSRPDWLHELASQHLPRR